MAAREEVPAPAEAVRRTPAPPPDKVCAGFKVIKKKVSEKPCQMYRMDGSTLCKQHHKLAEKHAAVPAVERDAGFPAAADELGADIPAQVPGLVVAVAPFAAAEEPRAALLPPGPGLVVAAAPGAAAEQLGAAFPAHELDAAQAHFEHLVIFKLEQILEVIADIKNALVAITGSSAPAAPPAPVAKRSRLL
jgi:hypothetical protein